MGKNANSQIGKQAKMQKRQQEKKEKRQLGKQAYKPKCKQANRPKGLPFLQHDPAETKTGAREAGVDCKHSDQDHPQDA